MFSQNYNQRFAVAPHNSEERIRIVLDYANSEIQSLLSTGWLKSAS